MTHHYYILRSTVTGTLITARPDHVAVAAFATRRAAREYATTHTTGAEILAESGDPFPGCQIVG